MRTKDLPIIGQLAFVQAQTSGLRLDAESLSTVSTSLMLGMELAMRHPEWVAAVLTEAGPFKRPDAQTLDVIVEALPIEAQS